jgi:hypothetical protein
MTPAQQPPRPRRWPVRAAEVLQQRGHDGGRGAQAALVGVRRRAHPTQQADTMGTATAKPFEPEAVNLFFQFVTSCYESVSFVVTNNKPFGRVGLPAFSDEVNPIRLARRSSFEIVVPLACPNGTDLLRPRLAAPHVHLA